MDNKMKSNDLTFKRENEQIQTGRRKTSIATVHLVPGTGEFVINGVPGLEYIQQKEDLLFSMQEPLNFLQLKNEFNINIKVKGGGIRGQVDAIKLAISRALCGYDLTYRSSLKLKGLLTRDARCKERKKYGLKKARKAPQFSKR
uniref:Small ribosomal subunit protein uS9c n=1 Tax=Hazenia capsulata TaxID=2202518 RepID=A0A1W6EHR3_9CHLO|nr:ribosomal protein S9 [Hazenia capsulata]ARK14885.1 ribosomal protein S9 [Hazenia capsulata]